MPQFADQAEQGRWVASRNHNLLQIKQSERLRVLKYMARDAKEAGAHRHLYELSRLIKEIEEDTFQTSDADFIQTVTLSQRDERTLVLSERVGAGFTA